MLCKFLFYFCVIEQSTSITSQVNNPETRRPSCITSSFKTPNAMMNDTSLTNSTVNRKCKTRGASGQNTQKMGLGLNEHADLGIKASLLAKLGL